ncbi:MULTISPECIES: hypothetical protein [unclassified Mycolicibacterium]|uniref:hypothetical protein n=1 Tax=unclassified Mycolicibacterium TaxID=2636767 RepID=UPI002ED7D213
MATSGTVFTCVVAFALVTPIAVFAWIAGNKHNKHNPTAAGKIRVAANAEPHRQEPPALRPQQRVGTNSPTSTAVTQRRPPNSATTQWDRADTMEPASQTLQTRRTADPTQPERH